MFTLQAGPWTVKEWKILSCKRWTIVKSNKDSDEGLSFDTGGFLFVLLACFCKTKTRTQILLNIYSWELWELTLIKATDPQDWSGPSDALFVAKPYLMVRFYSSGRCEDFFNKSIVIIEILIVMISDPGLGKWDLVYLCIWCIKWDLVYRTLVLTWEGPTQPCYQNNLHHHHHHHHHHQGCHHHHHYQYQIRPQFECWGTDGDLLSGGTGWTLVWLHWILGTARCIHWVLGSV